jgi:DNA-binding LacI/PurR family transcriptional regulator
MDSVGQSVSGKRKITIRDVAKHAGISYQTVSRVINDSESVAPETRDRILKAIDELNYRPSVAARALNSNRTNVIAVATPFDSDNLFEDLNLLQIIHGIDREAARHDYSLLLSTQRSVEEPFSPYQRLLNRQLADGMIVSGETVAEEGIHRVIERGYPVVIIGYNQLGVPCVHSDDETGAFKAGGHLLNLGHRKIAVITGPRLLLAVQARERGFARAFNEHGLDGTPSLVAEGDFTIRSGYAAMARLGVHFGEYSALFVHNDRMAIGAMHWLTEHGYTVPHDVSIVGFDDITTAELQSPALTTVRSPSMMLGQKAAEILFAILDGQALNTSTVTLDTELILRDSTAPVQA